MDRERHRGNITVAAFLVVRRAFDAVSHAHALNNLLNLGTGGMMFYLISDFLRGRRMFLNAIVGNYREHELSHGLP